MSGGAIKGLSQEDAKRLVNYDKDTGIARWNIRDASEFKKEKDCNQWNVKYAGKQIGSPDKDGYLRAKIRSQYVRVHRLVYFIAHGEWPDQIDHINHRVDDNRIDNLRAANALINQRNRPLFKKNKIGIQGVRLEGRKYRVRLNATHGSGQMMYEDFFEACCVRKSLEKKLNFHQNAGKSI